jgi:hypothetical protein
MATKVCLDFSLFPDDAPMPAGNFTLAGFSFALVGAGSQAFVNESGNIKGLQFPNDGIKFKLPVQSTKLTLKIGQFASPVTVEVRRGQGPSSTAILANRVTNSPNSVTTFNFRFRHKAHMVILTGGNNEGLLVEACYWV